MSKSLEFSLYSPPPSKEDIKICLANGERRLTQLYFALYLLVALFLCEFIAFNVSNGVNAKLAFGTIMFVTVVIFVFTMPARMSLKLEHDWNLRDTRCLDPEECKQALEYRKQSPLVDEYLNTVVALGREATVRELQLFRIEKIQREDKAVKQSLYGEKLPC
ncbi:hypothetical protein [Pseudomonas savastanoi]|uniref:hypothetical protein n=1 Tax=Pseudomonas savastanoi TaxID=29438 RepID=UPI001780FF80|nr:hypothetical protein [Pseudomonas savastanoi]QOI07928.1 hypothetical protein D5S10_29840 [Pseudomonas savastanoi]